MKRISSLKSPKFPSAGNPLPKQAKTEQKQWPFAFGYVPQDAMPLLPSRPDGTLSGTSLFASGPSPDEDTRGLSAEYLANEANKSLFIGMTFLVLGVHATMAALWLAVNHCYGAASALSVPAAIFWRNAWHECRRSARLFIAANLNFNQP